MLITRLSSFEVFLTVSSLPAFTMPIAPADYDKLTEEERKEIDAQDRAREKAEQACMLFIFSSIAERRFTEICICD